MVNALLLCDCVDEVDGGHDVLHVFYQLCGVGLPTTLNSLHVAIFHSFQDDWDWRDWQIVIEDRDNHPIFTLEGEDFHPWKHWDGVVEFWIKELTINRYGRHRMILRINGKVAKTTPFHVTPDEDCIGDFPTRVFGALLCDERELSCGSVHLRGVKNRLEVSSFPHPLDKMTFQTFIDNGGDLDYTNWQVQVHPPDRKGVWRLQGIIEPPTVRGTILLPFILKKVALTDFGRWDVVLMDGQQALAHCTLDVVPKAPAGLED